MESLDLNIHTKKVKKILENMNIMGCGRNIKWLQTMIKKYKILDDTETNYYIENLKILIPILNKKFKTKWDIIPNPTVVENKKLIGFWGLTLIILYPNLKISNSNSELLGEETHTLKDTVAVIPLGESTCFFGNLHLLRLTLSYSEWNKDYLHSHCRKYAQKNIWQYLKPSEFCIDNNSSFEIIRKDIEWNLTKEKAEMLLLSLQPMLEWESREGTPYIHYIKLKTNVNFDYNVRQSDIKVGYRNLLDTQKLGYKEKDRIKFKFYHIDGKYELKVTEELKESISKFLNDTENEEDIGWKYPLLSIKNGDRETQYSHYSGDRRRLLSSCRARPFHQDKPHMYIQGKKYEFNILDIKKEEIEGEKATVSNIFMKHLEEKINLDINKQIIIKNAIEKKKTPS